MQMDNIPLIAAIEVALVLLVLSLILFAQNRSLRKLVKKLKARMEQLVEELQAARRAPPQAPQQAPAAVKPEKTATPKTFLAYVNEQLELTREQHASLQPDRDIVLDLAPDTELPRRAAALRYAVFLAEKESITAGELIGDDFDWSIMRKKYQQIFDFYEDYTPEPEQVADHAELETLATELQNAKKRINNLEKFKALYFDLEEMWEDSKQQAKTHYDDLSAMASELQDKDKFEQALESYHSAYNSISKIIENGVGDPNAIVDIEKITDEETAGELRHLRIVAADQHKLINELQNKIKNADTQEERNVIVESLKGELDKQKRFMQESETCVQLMEDELKNAHKELDQLKGRLKTLPSIKSQMQEMRKQKDEYELKVYSLTSENRKLIKKLKDEKNSISVDDGQAAKLKKELTELETRYANLEEKYLDMKLNQS